MGFDNPDSLALWLSPAVLAVLGLLVGSFLNVVIYRSPVILMREWLADTAGMFDEGEVWKHVFGQPQPAEVSALGQRIEKDVGQLAPLGIATPRSRCGACGHAIRWYENLPVVSWLALRGRCAACNTRISARYPLIELSTGALFALAGWKFGPEPVTLAWCAALAALVAMSFIDLDTKYLPDNLTLPLLWGGLVAATLGWTIPLPTAVWGAVAGYIPLWLIGRGVGAALGREAMGAGDLKLLAALGAWTGWHSILPILLISSLVGLCVNVPRAIAHRHDRFVQYPFGPFLAAGGLIVIFVGADRLLEWAGITFPG